MINRITSFDTATKRQRKRRDDSAEDSAVSRYLATAEGLIRRHPGVVLAVGVAVGLAAGWWVKRR